MWLKYSEENLNSAKVLLESNLYNPCLHNILQSVEKSLNSLFIENDITFVKTHSILELKSILEKHNIIIDLTDDESDYFDSICLPTKYPIVSALPNFSPDKKICIDTLTLCERIFENVKELLKD